MAGEREGKEICRGRGAGFLNRKIKIVFFVGSLARGGAENQLLQLLHNLDRSQFEPYLILMRGEGAHRAAGLVQEVHDLQHPGRSARQVRGRMFRILRTERRLVSYLNRIRPDILHCFLPSACVLGVCAGRLAKIQKIVCSRRALVGSYRNSRLLTVADQWAMRHADLVLANSKAVLHELRDVDKIEVHRLKLIYNGVDIGAFSKAELKGCRTHFRIGEGDIAIGMMANFFPYKRHEDLVEAVSLLSRQCSNAKFILAGRDEGQLSFIMTLINRYELTNKFLILKEVEDTIPFYRSIDILVSSSETEGFSNVLLEAMAASRPIVATDVGGNSEAVAHNITGYVIPPKSPRALALALERLIRDPKLRQTMGEKGLLAVRARFSTEQMVQKHESCYRDLVLGQRGSVCAGAAQSC